MSALAQTSSHPTAFGGGATARTYVAKSADIGESLTVSVTGAKDGYNTVTRTSAATAVVTEILTTAPTPTISGTTKVGSTLTAGLGTWAPASITLKHQWKRAGVAITGATVRTYADIGKALTVSVTGLKTGYSSVMKTFAATAAVTGILTSTARPVISGTAKADRTLTATAGSWAPATVTLKYQWKRAGMVIVGATARTLVVCSTYVGSTLSVTVTGTKTSYTTVDKVSAATVKVVR